MPQALSVVEVVVPALHVLPFATSLAHPEVWRRLSDQVSAAITRYGYGHASPSSGSCAIITRQPVDGIANDGVDLLAVDRLA